MAYQLVQSDGMHHGSGRPDANPSGLQAKGP